MTEAYRVHGNAAAKKPKKGRRRAGPVSVDQVLPGAWATAMDLMQAPGSRLEIYSVGRVAVITPNR